MTDHQLDQQGLEASQVLASEAYKEAMKLLRESITSKWKACPIRDTEGQRLLLQTMRLADTFEEILSGLVERGKFAHRQIEIDQHRNETVAHRFMRRVL